MPPEFYWDDSLFPVSPVLAKPLTGFLYLSEPERVAKNRDLPGMIRLFRTAKACPVRPSLDEPVAPKKQIIVEQPNKEPED
jgi:hypothetical protein